MQIHTMTEIVNHSRSYAMKRGGERVCVWGGVGGRGGADKSILRGHNPRPWFCRVYTRHVFGPRKGFLKPACDVRLTLLPQNF